MSRTTIFGKISSNGKTIHIDDVQKENKLKFICAECESELVPVKTEARKKDWHFRHYKESNLVVCKQRGLHDFAEQVLYDAREIQISNSLRIKYTNPKKEAIIWGLRRSDVAVDFEESVLHFEVFVTNNLEAEKINYYNSNLVKCLKIDLSDKKYLSMSKNDLTECILNSTHNKTKFGWEGQIKIEIIKEGFWEKYGFGIVASAIFAIILYLMNRSMKRRRV